MPILLPSPRRASTTGAKPERVKGDVGVISGDGNAATASFGNSSLLAGADMWLNDRLLVGVEGGVTVSSLAVPDRSSDASVDAVHAGLYGGFDLDPLQFSFGASLSGQGAHVARTPKFSGLGQNPRRRYCNADGAIVRRDRLRLPTGRGHRQAVRQPCPHPFDGRLVQRDRRQRGALWAT